MPKTRDNNRGNRGGSRGKANNPEGRNQYSSGWIDMARERPAAAAAVAAGAAAAGVFLWSKRGQISDQLAHISDQIGEWTENMSSDPARRELELAGAETGFSGGTAGGEFSATPAGGTSRSTTARSARPSASKRRGATTGSGTMSGGSLDTGPSGRGRA